MFRSGKPKRPAQPPAGSIRDTLFGDLPLDQWPPAGAPGGISEPWASFVAAREALGSNRQNDARDHWKRIVATPGLQSRHYLQAWHFLRQHGVGPDAAQAKTLLGVVLEVTMERGLDLLAAYPEHTARYYNFSGAGVVWERPNDSMDAAIDHLLSAGQAVLNAIGPWHEPRPAPPPAGQVRMNLLSPAGLHFGQAPFKVLMNDPLAKPVIDAGVALMQQLVALDEKLRSRS